MRHSGCALKESPDAVPLDDLQDSARITFAAIDVDLNFGVILAYFPAKRRHDDFRIGHGFLGGFEERTGRSVADGSLAEKAREVVMGRRSGDYRSYYHPQYRKRFDGRKHTLHSYRLYSTKPYG